jgi:hypothetical protein
MRSERSREGRPGDIGAYLEDQKVAKQIYDALTYLVSFRHATRPHILSGVLGRHSVLASSRRRYVER